MKKTTFLFSILIFAFNVNAQVADFVSGMNAPQRLLVSGTNLYVKGEADIYVVDVTAATPTATSIFTAGLHQGIANFTISGTSLYIALETVNDEETETVNTTISKIDLNNLLAGAVPLYTSIDYINALTISGNTMYFTSEQEVLGTITSFLYSFDVTDVNPSPANIISGFGIVEELEFKDDIIYASDGQKNRIFAVNVNGTAVSLTMEYDLSFNRGIFINNNEIYITSGSQIKKGSLLDAEPITLQVVGENTTYQDNNGGSSYYANFRDLVLVGDKMYLLLQEQGKIVTLIDATLSSNEFSFEGFSLLNDNVILTLNGLKSQQNVSFYNLLGQSVINENVDASNNTISITNLKTGVYILKLNGQGKSYKFLKK